MTNKKFKLAAMSLATAVAVSTVGPSASAVTYQLEKGDVTVAENENGAFSYQGEDKDENRTYKVQKRIIPSLWKKMSRTRMETVTWISSLTA